MDIERFFNHPKSKTELTMNVADMLPMEAIRELEMFCSVVRGIYGAMKAGVYEEHGEFYNFRLRGDKEWAKMPPNVFLSSEPWEVPEDEKDYWAWSEAIFPTIKLSKYSEKENVLEVTTSKQFGNFLLSQLTYHEFESLYDDNGGD